jgi:hypothetical protein
VLNELSRYIKFNSNKLGFLRLRNKFFDRLRNQGFRKYGLSKLFAACSYSSRSKLLLMNDPVHISNVVQETAAEGVLMNLSETIFRQGMRDPFTATEEHTMETATEIKPFSRKDKVGCLSDSTSQKNRKPKIDYSLCMVLPGECHKFKKDISNIFSKELNRFNKASKSFKKCFENYNIEAIYLNEPTIGNAITKTKL